MSGSVKTAKGKTFEKLCFPIPNTNSQQVQKIRRIFRRIFICSGDRRNQPNCSAIIALAIIAHSNKTGKEIRHPKTP